MNTSGISRRHLIKGASGIVVLLAAARGGSVFSAVSAASGDMHGNLSVHEADTLLLLVKRLFPFDALSEGPYRLVIEAAQGGMNVEKITGLLQQGVRLLDSKAGGENWVDVSKGQQIQIMNQFTDTEFFNFMLNTSIHSLFRNREVWDLIGYQGPSMKFGGYINRGFDDIDWLPNDDG